MYLYGTLSWHILSDSFEHLGSPYLELEVIMEARDFNLLINLCAIDESERPSSCRGTMESPWTVSRRETHFPSYPCQIQTSS
ncbi:hypothetical protein F4809DRAFT_624759 [Biscogniauxia mediterranea]|nr:hypothetical protein F4809DRAFT_624759 [Biscogniauxia mediterranea]